MLRIVFLVLRIVCLVKCKKVSGTPPAGTAAVLLLYYSSTIPVLLQYYSSKHTMSTIGSTRKSTRMARKSTLGSTRKLSHLGLFSRAHVCALDCGSRAPDCAP